MKLACQLDPVHYDADFDALLTGWQPKSVKVINPSPGRVKQMLKACPNSLFVIRDHALSEQHDDMLRDPVGTGISHARAYANWWMSSGISAPTDQFVYTSINEPRIWDPGVPAALVTYTLSFLREMELYGLRGGVMNLSVGWPANTGTNAPPNWTPFQPVLDYLETHRQHFLTVHEYWCKDGPKVTPDLRPDLHGGPWGWTAGRIFQLDANVPILIGECGLEQAVCQSPIAQDKRGWRAYFSDPKDYVAQLTEYEWAIEQDPRIHSAQIFLLDGNTADWYSMMYPEVVPLLGRNTDFSWYVEDAAPPTPGDLYEELEAAGRAAQCIQLNQSAALQRAIAAQGLWPVANEAKATVSGVGQYVVQRAEDANLGTGYTFYCVLGDWGNVKYFRDVT